MFQFADFAGGSFPGGSFPLGGGLYTPSTTDIPQEGIVNSDSLDTSFVCAERPKMKRDAHRPLHHTGGGVFALCGKGR